MDTTKENTTMKNMTFINNGQKFRITEIMEAYGTVRDLGWSHFAEVKRPNGTKGYYANLFISNGEILNSTVVL
jgi:hypothetical protein